MLTDTDYAELQALAGDAAKVKRKRGSWLMWTLHVLLFVITFGTYKGFMDRFATTLLDVYIPEEWGMTSARRVLPHELRHAVQARRGLLVGWGWFYLFFPLPLGLAWGRFWCELDADRAGWKARLDEAGEHAVLEVRQDATRRADSVCGAAYLWAWPASWGLRAYRKAVEEVIATWRAGQ